MKAAIRGWVRRWGPGEDGEGRSVWARGRVLAGVAVLTAGLLAFHRAVPSSWGSLLEAFLPWLGLVVVVLLGLALLRRSVTALVALLLPVAAWTYLFGGLLLPGETESGLLVVQHNVSDENADPAGTARALADAGPDLIALEKAGPTALPVYEKTISGGVSDVQQKCRQRIGHGGAFHGEDSVAAMHDFAVHVESGGEF